MQTILYTIPHLLRTGPSLVLYGLVKNLDRTRFSPVVVTLSDERNNSLKPEFEKLGVEIYCLHKQSISTFLSGAWHFRQLLERIKPDIIHANGFRDILLTAFAAPKKYKKYATVHCDWAVDYRLKYGRLIGGVSSYLQAWALRKFSFRLACSAILADLLNCKYPKLHFDFVDNGVDEDTFHPVTDKTILRRELGLPMDKKIVIWTGSFIPRKDPLTMVNAILKIKEGSHYFIFCGARGKLLEECKNILRKRKDVLFTGYITNMKQYYQAADVYVSTSLSEGLPLAVLEAHFCGLPLILSDIPQHRYILQTETLPYCLFNTEQDLISKLTILLTGDNKSLLTTACQANIGHFSAKYMAEQYALLYK